MQQKTFFEISRFLLWLFLVLTIVSCHKDEPQELIIGDDSNLMVIPFKLSNQALADEEDKNKVDVNGDGIYDLNFIMKSSSANTFTNFSDLSCLHTDIEVYGGIFQDTIFNSLDTNIFVPGEVWITHQEFKTCTRLKTTDSILSYSNDFYPYDLRENDILNKSGDFLYSARFGITQNILNYHNYYGQSGPDTIVFKESRTALNCHEFEKDVTNYIGFRIRKKRNKKFKYGWVNFRIHSSSGLSIIESVIEE